MCAPCEYLAQRGEGDAPCRKRGAYHRTLVKLWNCVKQRVKINSTASSCGEVSLSLHPLGHTPLGSRRGNCRRPRFLCDQHNIGRRANNPPNYPLWGKGCSTAIHNFTGSNVRCLLTCRNEGMAVEEHARSALVRLIITTNIVLLGLWGATLQAAQPAQPAPTTAT